MQQQVLADCLDRLEHETVDGARNAGGGSARVRRLRLYPLTGKQPQGHGGAMDGVTLGHT